MDRVRNHRAEALPKPQINGRSPPSGRLARKAPSIMVPSMRAWGLIQVTTKAEEISFQRGTLTSRPPSREALDRRRPMPIQMTMRLPMPRMTFCSQGRACISAPAPRKHDTPRDTSHRMTIRAVRYTRLRRWVRALLMTNRFCSPMGATYARPMVRP